MTAAERDAAFSHFTWRVQMSDRATVSLPTSASIPTWLVVRALGGCEHNTDDDVGVACFDALTGRVAHRGTFGENGHRQPPADVVQPQASRRRRAAAGEL